jgi:uncharacterized membrane protein
VKLSNLLGRANGEPSPGDDLGFEIALGRLLGIGVLASTICLAAGLVMALAAGDSRPARGLLATGLVLLMATPVARVVLSAISYALRRDWVFVALTLVVFLQLVASVIVAFQSAH